MRQPDPAAPFIIVTPPDVAVPSGVTDALLTGLRDVGQSNVSVTDDLEAFAATLRDQRDSRFLILYDTAQSITEDALIASHPVDVALKTWAARTRAMLDLYRYDRSRIVFVLLQSLRARPGIFLERLADRLGVAPIHKEPLEKAIAAISRPAWPGVLAGQMLLHDTAIQRLDGELSAGSILPPRSGGDVAAALAEIAQIDVARAEELSRLRKDNDTLQTEKEWAMQKLNDTKRAQEAWQDMTTMQINATKAELHEAYLQTRRLREDMMAERQHLHREIYNRQHDIDQLIGSSSWRLTEPLRRARGLLNCLVKRSG